jgi:hypothetical protein
MLENNNFTIINSKIDILSDNIKSLEERINKFEHKIDSLDTKFVTVDRFRPVEMVCYGIISLFGGGLIVAILALVLKK